MAEIATREQIAELYIATFNRAADADGLNYWISDGTNATTGLTDITLIATAMLESDEVTARYGDTSAENFSREDFIIELYANILNRTVDATDKGVKYWVEISTVSNAELIIALINGAKADSGNPEDAKTLANKTTVGLAFAEAGLNDVEFAISIMNPVTNDDATVTSAEEEIDGMAPQVVGETFTLTAGVDIFTGTADNDTFIADNSSGNNISSVADEINGGLGNDTLKIYSDGTHATVPNLTSIENVMIFDHNDAFDVSSSTGVETVTVTRGEGDDTITVGAGVSVSLENITIGSGSDHAAQTIAFDAEDTTATINLTKLTAKGTDNNEDVIINGAALTTVNVNATATESTFDALDVAAATTVNLNAAVNFTAPIETTGTAGTLNITGAGAVDIGAIDDGFTTVNASAATGNLTMTAQANNANASITLGSGNDTFTTDDDGFASADTFAVNAGDGDSDKLVIAAAVDIDTADEAARYTNFEILSLSNSQDVSLISGITSIEIGGTANKSLTGLTATQAANVTITASQTIGFTAALAVASGSSDALTLNLTSATATTNVNVAGLVTTGYETLNINATTGTSGTNSTVGLGASGDLTKVNVTGTADVAITGTPTTKAITVDATALTGDFTISGDVATASTINAGAGDDKLTVSTNLGSTYNAGAGDDTVTTVLANLVSDGSDDTVINGEAGTDTLAISDTTGATTLTDNHFTNVTNMENLTILESSDTFSLEAGAAFNSAFTSGITITAASMADAKTFVYNGGLYGKDTTIDLTTAATMNAALEDITITTGAGNDTVTVTAANLVGAATNSSAVTISTNAGNDSITVSTGIVVSDSTQVIVITAGKGADTIDISSTATNATNQQAAVEIVIADGDSLVGSYDTITGFAESNGTEYGDILNFDTNTVGTLASSTDYNTIASHSITSGYAKFNDASAAELVINSGNIADVIGYIEANGNANATTAFAYDSTGNGVADATMVYHNGSDVAHDSLVMLAGITSFTAVGLTAATDHLLVIA